jgi:hypothetical protein
MDRAAGRRPNHIGGVILSGACDFLRHMRNRQSPERRREVEPAKNVSFMRARCAKAAKSRSAERSLLKSEPIRTQAGARPSASIWCEACGLGFKQTKDRPKGSLHPTSHDVCRDKARLLRVTGDPISRRAPSRNPQPRAPEPIGQKAQPAADCVSPEAADGIAKDDLARKKRRRPARNIVSRRRQFLASKSAWLGGKPEVAQQVAANSRRWWQQRHTP